jgi:hypothetical protein
MVAAELGLAGINPMLFLKSKDPGVISVLQLVAAATRQIREREQHNLAVLIANKVGELFGGGQ